MFKLVHNDSIAAIFSLNKRTLLQGQLGGLVLATTSPYNMAIILTSGHNKIMTSPGDIG